MQQSASLRLSRYFIPLLIVLLGAGGFALLVKSKPRSEASPRTERAWPVAVAVVTPATLQPVLTLYGRVQSPRQARIRAAIEADVIAVEVLEGATVTAGQPLVRLNPGEARALVEQRRAEVAEAEAGLASEFQRARNDKAALVQEQRLLELAQAELARAQNLLQRGLGSAAQLDAARRELVRQELALESREYSIADHDSRRAQWGARLDRARAALVLAEIDLAHATLSAPFAGRVARVAVAPGDRVRIGDTMVEIYDSAALEVRAQIPATQLGAVQAALAQGGSLEAIAQTELGRVPLRLERLAAEVARGSGGVDALLAVQPQAQALQLGQFLTVYLSLPPDEGLVALPFEALYGRGRIYKVVDGRLQGLEIERAGELRAPGAEPRMLVSSPSLRAGDRVLVTQLPNAVDGLLVEASGG